jgi:O-antigen/teichoic acid export membrane protein
MLAGLLFPATALAAAAAPELIDILLGPKWDQLSLMLRVFLPISALSIIAVQVGPILLAINRFKLYFWCAIALSLGRLIAVCAGFWIGLTGVVFGLAMVTLLHFVVLILLSEPLTGCRVGPMLRGLVGPAISSLAGAGVCFLVLRWFSPGLAVTIAALVIGLIVFAVGMLSLDRDGLKEDWEVIRRIIKARGGS